MNVNLSMPPQFNERLDQHAATTGMNKSEIVRRALDEYFERLDRKKKEAPQ